MTRILVSLTALGCVALGGCTPGNECDALRDMMSPAERQARVVAWVDEQAAAGKLAEQFAVPSKVPRPGSYAIALDASLGFGNDFAARVIKSDRRPVAVFIGNAAYRGFIVDLVAEGRHFGLPPDMPRLGDRVALLRPA